MCFELVHCIVYPVSDSFIVDSKFWIQARKIPQLSDLSHIKQYEEMETCHSENSGSRGLSKVSVNVSATHVRRQTWWSLKSELSGAELQNRLITDLRFGPNTTKFTMFAQNIPIS